MPAQKVTKKRSTKRPILDCNGAIHDWAAYVYVRAARREQVNSRESLLALNIQGEFTKAIRTVSAFLLRIYPEPVPRAGNGTIPYVGIWTAAKPRFDGAIYLSHREFDLLLAMAQSNKLVSVHLSFQQPRDGTGLIASAFFSSAPTEHKHEVSEA